jgi:hypothetical protein
MRHSDGRHDRKEPIDHAVLRKKIEDAINDSLDPLAAHKALKSLHPLFQDLSECKREDWSLQKISLNSDARRKQLFKKTLKSGHDELEKKPIYLPSIQTILTDYRVKLSLKPILQHPAEEYASGKVSATCDTVKGTDERTKHDLYQKRKESESSSSSYGESSYDSSAAVMLLRLERLTRREKFSSFWQWKTSDHGTSDLGMTGQSKDYVHTETNSDRGIKAADKGIRESKVERVRRMQEIYRTQALESDDGDVRSPESIPSVPAPPALPAHTGIKALDNSAADDMHTLIEKSNAAQNITASAKHVEDIKNVTDSDLSMISRYFMTVEERESEDVSQRLLASPSDQSDDSSAILRSTGPADTSLESLQGATMRRAETERGLRTKTVAGAGAVAGMRKEKKKMKGVRVAIEEVLDHIKSTSDRIQEINSVPSTARSLEGEHSAVGDTIGKHRPTGLNSGHQIISPHSEPSLIVKELNEVQSARDRASSKKSAHHPSELHEEGHRNGHENRQENGHENRHEDGHELGHADGREECSIVNSEEEEECDWDSDWEASTQHTSRNEDPQRGRDRNGARGHVQDLLDWMENLDPDTV